MNKFAERVELLRSRMKEEKVDEYIIGTEDFHCSEYVGDFFKCRAYVSGFTGSAGTLVVRQDFAGLWTDGRYFLQAGQQLEGSGIELMKMHEPGVPELEDFVADSVKPGECLGFDGRCMNARVGRRYRDILTAKGARVRGDLDLVGDIWADRPEISKEPAWVLDVKYAGKSREQKIAELRETMEKAGADIFIMSALADNCWLLNIRGNDIQDTPVLLSNVIVTKDTVTLYALYGTMSDEILTELAYSGVAARDYWMFYEDIKTLPAGKCAAYDPANTNFRVEESFPAGLRIMEVPNARFIPKAIKNPVEVGNIKKAHLKDGVALTKFMYWLKKCGCRMDDGSPLTEISAAQKMESFRKEQEGYIEPSFEPISGYAEHGAIVHYSATPETNAEVQPKGLLLMDTGAQYYEGTTDITRTFVMGPLTDYEKTMFTQVLKGHLNLLGARFLYGCTGQNLDYLAREPLWQMGMDYNHGTGHGVGFVSGVHEGPNGFRWRSVAERNDSAVLEEGMLTSDEPGIYIENAFGIRHESLILCEKAEKNEYGQFMKFEPVTLVPFDLEGVDASLMSEREKILLNDYHRKVRMEVSPFLNDEEKAWLTAATREI
ncbi:MAG: aminopeptidase P family protein [Lachnospiraceae bacterium]|nr:aminopeptidase P family protein [Lachnospiraceae bacterium]